MRRYMATGWYRGLWEKGRVRSEDDPFAIARHRASETLAEYTRLLKIVTDLAVHGGKHETQVRTAEGKA